MGFLLLLFFLTAPDLPFYTADATWIARYNQARRELERGAYRNSEQLGAACLAEARQAADGGNQAIVLSLLHLTELHEKYGRYRAGDSLAARALVLCERSGEERWPVLRAQLLAVQARCLIHLERYEAAGRQLDTAETLLRYYLGEDHPGMAAVYGPMGLLALERQAYPQAADYHRRALGLRRHAPEAPSATDAVLSYQLAEVFLQQHRFSAADSLLQQAEDILRQQNPQHPELAYVYNHWARVQLDRSRLFQARLYLEKAERLQVAKLGGEHLHLAKIHLNWANYYHTSDSLPQARLRLDAAEALLRRQSMEESAVQGLVLAAYSQLYYEERNAWASLDYLQRALPLFRRRDKPQEYILSLVKQTMQRADTVQVEDEARYRKEIGAAIDTLLAAKDQWEAHGFPRDLNYAHLLERIGYLYDYYLGENHESEKWYLQARVVMEALLAGPEGSLETVNEDYINVIKNLAILYDLSGRPEPAEQFYFEALEKDSLLFGVDHPRYIQTLNDLGAFYAFHLEDAASAERYFRRAGRGQVDLIREYYAFLDEKGRAEYLDNIYFYLSEFLRFGASYELSAAALEALDSEKDPDVRAAVDYALRVLRKDTTQAAGNPSPPATEY